MSFLVCSQCRSLSLAKSMQRVPAESQSQALSASSLFQDCCTMGLTAKLSLENTMRRYSFSNPNVTWRRFAELVGSLLSNPPGSEAAWISFRRICTGNRLGTFGTGYVSQGSVCRLRPLIPVRAPKMANDSCCCLRDRTPFRGRLL